VFQFDFLNDGFSKLPPELKKIIDDPEKRKKLIIYINPPYAEHGSRATMIGTGENKTKVATEHKIYKQFAKTVGAATRELFAQFFLRVYKDIPNAKLAAFGKLKYVVSQNFIKFREYFNAEYKGGFICRADTFDNVKGKFPISFLIWDLGDKQEINKVVTDILLTDDKLTKSQKDGIKNFYPVIKGHLLIDWLRKFYDNESERIGYLRTVGSDFENNRGLFFTSNPSENDITQHFLMNITQKNILEMCLFLAVRLCIEPTWLNDRDQFLRPNDGWKTDTGFQHDCLVFTLFHGQNRISAGDGVNHWIPFAEKEVGAKEKFESNFMSKFLKDKTLSPEAAAVLDAGQELWKYYHAKIKTNRTASVNASFYDIREFFQGRKETGTMNSKSNDETYNALIKTLREKQKTLAKKIEPKIYKYGFLKK
jgi:hypothetical protein